ncbi:flagellar export chaperone FliS [Cohnella rhizosphaerae]|uniref:Flagellar secretion chaperone FliS n=1 Tax=Cohnella rhizosphaerae TaxID=1457232 RepID=A0A9X4KWL8_9BACL|nr:flagellar export chaperone FliS [Cohnella rhizosphaerae]MDG0811868.1 flagellar export chaperone FliS [Cohnella rhizosphaerae]
MLKSPYQAYQQSSVQTSTPIQLVLMLYDGAIRYTRASAEAIRAKDYNTANLNLKKAQSVIHELTASLNFDFEVSKNLASLYEYFLHTLIQANIKKDARCADEVTEHLNDLREAWRQTAKLAAAEQGAIQGGSA